LPPVDEVAGGDEWNTIETFTGEGDEITPPFHISGTEWRITLTADAEYPEYAVLHVLVYPEGTHSICTKRISYSGGSGGDTVYICEGGQDYYIEVIAANLRSWTIRVENYGTRVSLSPVQITHIHYEGTVYPPEAGRCLESGEFDEYVVIKNLGDCVQDISGWVLKNATKGYPSFTFPSVYLPPAWTITVYTSFPVPPGQIVEAYEYLVLDPSPSGGFWRMYELYPLRFDYPPGDIWDNEEPDTAVLYNAQGEEVSRKSYTIPTAEASSTVQITNIHYKGTLYLLEPDDSLGLERVEIDEYVEIRHVGGYPEEPVGSFQDLSPDERVQDMSGWVLRNITKGYPSFTFPVGFLLFPGEIIRIYTHAVHPEFVYTDQFHTRTAELSFNYAPGDLWDNEEADIAVLYNAKGEEVARRSYRVPTHNKAPASE